MFGNKPFKLVNFEVSEVFKSVFKGKKYLILVGSVFIRNPFFDNKIR